MTARVDIERLTVTRDPDTEHYRVTALIEDGDLGVVDHYRGVVRPADGFVVIALVPDESLDEVRYDRQRGATGLETLLQAREALETAIAALQSCGAGALPS